MKDTKFTPGPWEFNELTIHPKGLSSIIAEIQPNRINGESEPNARLISYSPDMYEALEEAYKELTFHNWQNSNTGLKIAKLLTKIKG